MISDKEKARRFLEIEVFAAMEKAETQKDHLAYVKKANALKKSCNETKEEIKTLERTLLNCKHKLCTRYYNILLVFIYF